MFAENKQVDCFRGKSSVPKYLLQGTLFPATKSPEGVKKERLIETYSGKTLSVSHEGFSQFDLAVSLAYKKIITKHNNFDEVVFNIIDFSNAMNRKDGGKTRQYILEAFRRSNEFHLCFNFNNGNFDGYRLNKFTEIRTNEFKIAFNMDYLSMVYDENEVCDINIDIFLSLQLGLQSWLYGFICSVPDMKSLDIDNLHKYSGSNYQSQSDFKKAVKHALYVLHKKGVIGWSHGITRDGKVFWQYENPFAQK